MPPLSRREFTAWNGLTFNLVTILQAHDAAIRALTLNHAGTYIASAGQSGIVKYFKTNMNNLTAWRAQRGPFSRQIMHDLQLPVMTLRWGSGLSRRVERSASLPATDGTSNASSGTQQWASVCQAARTILSSSGIPELEPCLRRCIRILLFLAVQGKQVDMMPP